MTSQKKNMYSSPALNAGHPEYSGEVDWLKSADGKALHFTDDASTIQNKSK